MKQCFSLLLLFCWVVNAAPQPTRSAPPQVAIRALVKKTMAHVLKEEGSGPSADFEEHNEAALPFLESYSHSNNNDIRFAVQGAAEREHSALALQLLSNIMVRPDDTSNVADISVDFMADDYTRTELGRWGGEPLRQRLMQLAIRKQYFSKAILLLPAFPGNATRNFLRKLGATPSSTDYKFDYGAPTVKRSFVVDIALSEMGDEVAFGRLTRTIGGKSIPERVWLCHALPLIQNRRILKLIPPLLNDYRIARKRSRTINTEKDGEPTQIEVKLAPFRVCDVAARAISFRVNDERRYYEYLYHGPPLSPSDLAKVRALRF